MSHVACSILEAVGRLRIRDRTLTWIDLTDKQLTDSELDDLTECLLIHPDIVVGVYLSGNRLTDETGVKLTQYVAVSSTIRGLSLRGNQFGETTYLALAAALRINRSLKYLGLYDNRIVDGSRINCIDMAFINALILNPNRPGDSDWGLYSYEQSDFSRLKSEADRLGHPSMQASLALLAL